MKLYILYASDDETSIVVGIFDTKEKPEQIIKDVDKNAPDYYWELSVKEITLNDFRLPR